MSIKAIYYSGENKVYEIKAYEGFSPSKAVIVGDNLQKKEDIEVDLIEMVENEDSNVIRSFKKNLFGEWYVDIVSEIQKHYAELDLQLIEGYDCCIVGVICVDSQECILYDSGLIKNQMLRGDLAIPERIEFELMEMQRTFSECAFTDFPNNN